MKNTLLDYDPLEADPDYLVVGPFSRRYQLYDKTINDGNFVLIAGYPGYEVYERVVPQ